MRAGLLLSRIAIEKRIQGQGPLGQPINTWVTLADVWADVRHLSGTESIKAGAVTSAVNASARIRWRTDVTAAHRVMHEGRAYDVGAVLPDSRREYVDLLLKMVM